jgi:hypothetical protein
MVYISSSDYLSVRNRNNYFNIFNSKGIFLYKVDLLSNPIYRSIKNKYNFDFIMGAGYYCVTEKQNIVFLQAMKINNNESATKTYLICYDTRDSLIEKLNITLQDKPVDVNNAQFFGTVLSDNRIVFLYPFIYNKKQPEKEVSYRLCILSKDGFEKSEIVHAINQSEIVQILSDRQYIFVISQPIDAPNNYLIDIFNANEKRYVQSVLFPFLPRAIRNGYAYTIRTGKDIYPVVEKYKLDTKVYGNSKMFSNLYLYKNLIKDDLTSIQTPDKPKKHSKYFKDSIQNLQKQVRLFHER